MKKEEDKKKKIYRYLDNLYSKSEVEDILKDIQPYYFRVFEPKLR